MMEFLRILVLTESGPLGGGDNHYGLLVDCIPAPEKEASPYHRHCIL